ncbi:MAG: hypothetical protein KatS3mg015_2758 [Fimbriimonadales bacterium]|nr:MAG: hypothetical protein KatS3mg015_2758 [Fimbriimonadales bacterium]
MSKTLVVGARLDARDLCVILRAALGGGHKPRTKSELVGMAVSALAQMLCEEDAGLRPASLDAALDELERAFGNLRGAPGTLLRRRNDSSVRRALLEQREDYEPAVDGAEGADPELVQEVMRRLTAPEAFDLLRDASGVSEGEDEVIDPQVLEQLLRGHPKGGPSGGK